MLDLVHAEPESNTYILYIYIDTIGTIPLTTYNKSLLTLPVLGEGGRKVGGGIIPGLLIRPRLGGEVFY